MIYIYIHYGINDRVHGQRPWLLWLPDGRTLNLQRYSGPSDAPPGDNYPHSRCKQQYDILTGQAGRAVNDSCESRYSRCC